MHSSEEFHCLLFLATGGGIDEIQPPSAKYEPYALSTMYYEIVMNSEFV